MTDRMFSNREMALMKKLKCGGVICDEERDVAYRLGSIGILQFGYDEEDGETGRLSPNGRRMLRRENIEGNPWRRLLHAFVAPF